MSDDPDAIRADIEATRRNLSGDVDALADKVTPSKIAERQTRKVKGAFHSLSDRVMGTADDVRSNVSGTASDAGDAVADAGRTVVNKAQGNPLAVGLIAFGVGALVASLIPASTKEKELASSAKDAAQPLLQEAAEVGKQVANDLKEPAQQAVQSVKETAQEGVSTVKEEATDRASDVADDAKQSGQRLQSDQ
ncbi:DUF3618 domain-containing protein [Leifsonia sp. fls2-241-R2A-40a]|uniref:DUF3618 domain-containing protein n=1 Tax=Leifsonia sp. fls2-241-R2A-40a TaxID=3040290 RepID=UPI002550821F|nr:DUF3618 domain-containing protein [Leifsonia sp. fls2-241-R2A-40a]